MNNKCIKCNPTGNKWHLCETHKTCDDCGTKEKLCHCTEGLLCDPCHKKRVKNRINSFSDSTSHTNEITCPHCGYESGDSWEMDEGEMECHDCEQKFEMTRHHEVTYTTVKIKQEKRKHGR